MSKLRLFWWAVMTACTGWIIYEVAQVVMKESVGK